MPLFNQPSAYTTSDWKQVTADYSIVKGDKLIVNTSSGALQLFFPTSPILGQEIEILTGVLNNPIIVDLQGHKVNGNTIIADAGGKITNNYQYLKFIYFNADIGWLSIADALSLNISYFAEVISDEPWAYLRLNETSGNIAYGETNNINGTYYGTYQSVSGPLNFDDNNKAIKLTNNGYISFSQLIANPSQFTLECRFRTLKSNATLFAFSDNQQTSGNYQDRELMILNGKLQFRIYQVNNFCYADSPQFYNDGQWHTVTAVCGLQGTEIWVDKNLVISSANCTNPISYSGYWHIGYSLQGGYSNNTEVDEVSITPRALSHERIIARHTASLSL